MDSQLPLKIYFLPLVTASSHSLPLYNLARVFAAFGQDVTIITSPSNASLLKRSSTSTDNLSITYHVIPMPFKEVGLPENTNEVAPTDDLDTATKLHQAFFLLRQPIEDFLETHLPDCIVSDGFYTWSSEAAARLGIPRLVFSPYGAFSLCLKYVMLLPDSPHQTVESDHEPFLIPGLPDVITMTRAQIPSGNYTVLTKMLREAEMDSYGVIINTFYELESAYVEQHKKSMGHKVFPMGPTHHFYRQQCRPKLEDGEHECLSWLNSKEPNSVIFLCFGSFMKVPDEQLKEIGCALESSGHYFIWVVPGKADETRGEEEEEKWLPKGFYDNINGRGLIAKGWIPQTLILEHPSTGGFITHCGWSSILESISAGVPFVTWPLSAESFYNEKLLTKVLGIGLEVGIDEWALCFDLGKSLIKRERIEKAVRKLMDGSDEAEERRRKVVKLQEKAKMAVKEGGSSHKNLTVLIEELQQLREIKIRSRITQV